MIRSLFIGLVMLGGSALVASENDVSDVAEKVMDYPGGSPLLVLENCETSGGIRVSGPIFEDPLNDSLLFRPSGVGSLNFEVGFRWEHFSDETQQKLRSAIKVQRTQRQSIYSKHPEYRRYQYFRLGPIPRLRTFFSSEGKDRRMLSSVFADEEYVYLTDNGRSLFRVELGSCTPDQLRAIRHYTDQIRNDQQLNLGDRKLLVSASAPSFFIVTVNMTRGGKATTHKGLIRKESLPKYQRDDWEVLFPDVERLTDQEAKQRFPLLLEFRYEFHPLWLTPKRVFSHASGLVQPDGTPCPFELGYETLAETHRHYTFWMQALHTSDHVSKSDVNNAAHLLCVSRPGHTRRWTLATGAVFDGELLGRLEAGFVFRLKSRPPIYVSKQRLAAFDRSVATMSTEADDLSWLNTHQLHQIFSHQLDSKARIEPIQPTVDDSIAVIAGGEVTSSQSFADISDLLDMRETSKLQRQLRNVEKESADLKQILFARRREFETEPIEFGDSRISELLDVWRIREGAQIRHFRGELLGELDGDFVFQAEFQGKSRKFVVRGEQLDLGHKLLASKLSPLLETEPELKNDLVDEHWNQPYRCWPSSYFSNKQFVPAVLATEFNTLEAAALDGRGGLPFQTITGKRLQGRPGLLKRSAELRDLIEGQRERHQERLKNFPKWTFRESDGVLRSKVVADAGNDVLMEDPNGRKFLIMRGNFDQHSFQAIEEAISKLPAAVRYDTEMKDDPLGVKRLRIWCGTHNLIGPARHERASNGVVYFEQGIDANGNRFQFPFSSLTLRESLALKARWDCLIAGQPDSREIDFQLGADVNEEEVIRRPLKVTESLQARLNFTNSNELDEWISEPINLDAGDRVVSLGFTGNSLLVRKADSRIQLLSLKNGVTRSVDIQSKVVHGPWINESGEESLVWWANDSSFYCCEPSGEVSEYSAGGVIACASLSGNGNSVVVALSDRRVHRFSFTNRTGEQLVPRSEFKGIAAATQIWASYDGRSFVAVSPTGPFLFSFNTLSNGKTITTRLQLDGRLIIKQGHFVAHHALLKTQHGMTIAVDMSQPRPIMKRLHETFEPIHFQTLVGPNGMYIQLVGRPKDVFYQDSDKYRGCPIRC